MASGSPIVRPALIVHGGAGEISDDRVEAVRAGCLRAVDAGLAVLAAGGAALDAAQAAVRVLEDEPEFNAGVGSVLTRAGTLEMDAALMDGRTLRVGAVAAMRDARHAIDIARAVLEDGEHVLLCGDGAWAFAAEHGFSPGRADELTTARARERLAQARARHDRGAVAPLEPGTVGACAIDAGGHVAAATSTGGITFKRPGRVGDTPLPGCGTYADDLGGAASATGHGESIIRVTMTRSCADLMRHGLPADQAARRSVAELGARTGGQGGIVCVDPLGRVGAAHSSARMAWATAALAEGKSVGRVAQVTVDSPR